MPTIAGMTISAADLAPGPAVTRPRARRLLVRLDADDRVGMGHAVRTGGLLDAIAHPLDLEIVGAGGLSRLFPRARIHDHSGDGEHLGRLVTAIRPDAILIDVPRYEPGLWRALRMAGGPVIAIDDYGGAVEADLIINGTVLDAFHRYTDLPSGARVLAGPRHTLIRPEFGATPWRDPATNSVAIVVGSAERARAWAFMLSGPGIDRSGWGEVTMVVGGAFADAGGLARACAAAGIALRQGLAAAAMAGLLANSAVALITGGMVVYEALAVGVPAVVFPQVENLVQEAAWFADHGCIRDLGYEGGMEPERVSGEVRALLDDRAARRAMSARARAIVDGRGMRRAADAIDALLAKVAP